MIETEGRHMVATEAAKFSLGRKQWIRGWESEKEHSNGSENMETIYIIRLLCHKINDNEKSTEDKKYYHLKNGNKDL